MITVVIPTYRRPQLLKRAIESALNQTEKNFTLLIVDNHSQDETEKVVRAYQAKDKRICYLENREKIGAAANFKYGLDAVNTPFISFLPDDDYLTADFLKDCLDCFACFPDIIFAGGGGCYVDNEGNEKPFIGIPPADGYYENPNGYIAYVSSRLYPIFGALLFNTALLKKIGMDERINMGLDEDLIGRCAATHPVYFLCSKNYYKFYENPHSLSRHPDYSVSERGVRCIQENIFKLEWHREQKQGFEEFFRQRLHRIFSMGFRHYLSLRE